MADRSGRYLDPWLYIEYQLFSGEIIDRMQEGPTPLTDTTDRHREVGNKSARAFLSSRGAGHVDTIVWRDLPLSLKFTKPE